jgi:hypothetical protein
LQPRSQHHMFCQHEGLLERGLLEERGERREEMRPGHEKKKQTNPGESHVMLTALQQLLTSKRGECTMHGTIFYQHEDTRTQAAGSLFLQWHSKFRVDQNLLAISRGSARPGCIHCRTVDVAHCSCTQSGLWQDMHIYLWKSHRRRSAPSLLDVLHSLQADFKKFSFSTEWQLPSRDDAQS